MIPTLRKWSIWFLLLGLTLLPHLASFYATDNLVSAQTMPDRQQFYRRLAYFHAPINFQDTEVRGESQDEGKSVECGSADPAPGRFHEPL